MNHHCYKKEKNSKEEYILSILTSLYELIILVWVLIISYNYDQKVYNEISTITFRMERCSYKNWKCFNGLAILHIYYITIRDGW